MFACCDLSPRERVLLEAALTEILNLKEDRALIVDMGPGESVTILGNAREMPRRAVVVVGCPLGLKSPGERSGGEVLTLHRSQGIYHERDGLSWTSAEWLREVKTYSAKITQINGGKAELRSK